MDKLLPGVSAAVAEASRAGGLAAADAIRTTDTVVKIAFRRLDGYSIGGMAKGAAMLAPGLATMLCVLTTDADLDPGPAGRRAPDGHRDDLRPARHRRLHVHQRHGAADGQRGIRGGTGQDRVHPGPHRGVRGPGPADAAGRRGREQDDHDRGGRGGLGGRRGDRRARRGPQQPAQVRPRRRGPQLGPGTQRGRHHRRGLPAGPAERRDQRDLGLPARRPGRRARRRST